MGNAYPPDYPYHKYSSLLQYANAPQDISKAIEIELSPQGVILNKQKLRNRAEFSRQLSKLDLRNNSVVIVCHPGLVYRDYIEVLDSIYQAYAAQGFSLQHKTPPVYLNFSD